MSGGVHRVRWWVASGAVLTCLFGATAAQAQGVRSLAGADVAACAALSSGGVDCWGDNESGELGDGGACGPFCTTAVPVTGIGDATQVAGGWVQMCALLATGGVDCWGYNLDGELGDGTTQESTTPVAVSGITNAIGIATGYEHGCALLATHRVECWGTNNVGQLGNLRNAGTQKPVTTPVAVSGISNAVAISAGFYDSCALLATQRIKCWGANNDGQLGAGISGSLLPYSATPVTVSKITNATAVATGWYSSCAILATGGLDCWGDNEAGELGTGNHTATSKPVPVPGLAGATSIATNGFHTCAGVAGGGLDCWGRNVEGEVGIGTTSNSVNSPAAVAGLTTTGVIAAGTEFACAALSSGGVDCWGDNRFGELGDGSLSDHSATPGPVTGLP